MEDIKERIEKARAKIGQLLDENAQLDIVLQASEELDELIEEYIEFDK